MRPSSARTLRLQAITIAWMLIECAVALAAALRAHSAALFAFGSDSLVELLSALVVVLPLVGGGRLRQQTANRAAAVLLFALALVVCAIAAASLAGGVHAESSYLGLAVTVAALVAMPVLAALKHREARRTGNAALAADAVQSATCAYLAAITLAGLAMNAIFRIGWFDSLAALAAVPLLAYEGRQTWKGRGCGCGA